MGFNVLLLTTSIILLYSGSLVFGSSWTYDDSDEYGPSNWTYLYSDCGGDSQSPINLQSSVAEESDYDPFTFVGFGGDIALTFENNGHSAQASLTSGDIYFEDGGLSTTYKVAQFHFHWGSMSDQGSEHEVDGGQYEAEMHIVGWDSDNYDSMANAQTEAGGLAVLSVLIQEESSSDFETLTVAMIGEIPNEGDTYDIASGTITLSDFLPSDTDAFYRYNGSLTTPACYESVYWTVFTETRGMTSDQLNAFRDLSSNTYGNETLVDNYRPVQSLNSRTLYLNEATPLRPLPILLLAGSCLLVAKYFK